MLDKKNEPVDLLTQEKNKAVEKPVDFAINESDFVLTEDDSEFSDDEFDYDLPEDSPQETSDEPTKKKGKKQREEIDDDESTLLELEADSYTELYGMALELGFSAWADTDQSEFELTDKNRKRIRAAFNNYLKARGTIMTPEGRLTIALIVPLLFSYLKANKIRKEKKVKKVTASRIINSMKGESSPQFEFELEKREIQPDKYTGNRKQFMVDDNGYYTNNSVGEYVKKDERTVKAPEWIIKEHARYKAESGADFSKAEFNKRILVTLDEMVKSGNENDVNSANV